MELTPSAKRRLELSRVYASARWKALRAYMIKKAGGPHRAKCSRCDRPSMRFELHHLSHKHLGNERPSEVLLVCRGCHDELHRELEAAAKRNRQLGAARTWQQGMQTYVAKKYGEDFLPDFLDFEEEFSEWVQEKEEREGLEF